MTSLAQPGPYHLLAYGTLLGSTFYQSFVSGILEFKALPRPQFSQLQQVRFPYFFGLQTLLPVAMALTYPVRTLPTTLGSVGMNDVAGKWDVMAVFEASRRWGVLVPLGVMFVSGLVNWVYVGPETTRVMRVRKHQETKDGRKSYDKGPHSPEMEQLNRTFGILHGVSTLINLAGFGAMIGYGFHLGLRL